MRAGFLRRFWFTIALGLLVPIALAFPGGGERLRTADGVLTSLVALTLFLSSFALDPSHLRRQIREGKAIALGFAATYAIAPALGWLLARALGPAEADARSDFLAAVMIAATQASTLASAQALTLVAGGDVGLALVITIVSNLATVVLTPLWLEATLGVAVSFPAAEMIRQMALMILGPVVAGQAARPFLWQAAWRIRGMLRVVPQAIILVFVYTAVASAADRLWQAPGLAGRFLAVAVALHLGLLGATGLGARWLGLSDEARVAVVFCGSQKTLPNGIYIWDRFFSANPHGAVALVVLHVFQLVLDAAIVPWVAPRKASPPRPR